MNKLEHYGNAFATLAEAVDVATCALSAVEQRARYIRLLSNLDPSFSAEALAKRLESQARTQGKKLAEIHIQIQDLLEAISAAHQERQGDNNG